MIPVVVRGMSDENSAPSRRCEHIELGWYYQKYRGDDHPLRLVSWNETTGACEVVHQLLGGRVRFYITEGTLRRYHAIPPDPQGRPTKQPDAPWTVWK